MALQIGDTAPGFEAETTEGSAALIAQSVGRLAGE
jgi:hypothetical protein